MSKGPVKVSAEEAAKNQAFLASMAASGKERYIKRHSLQARLTHGITIAACILLCISGLFVFVPALAAAVGADTVFAIRMSHRIIGVVFVVVPLISALLAPKGVAHIFKNLFDRWDSDDKKWMMLFFPYLFMAKWIHMPDQREVKSGQRFADGMLWFAGALMGITGIILLLGTTLFDFGAGVHGVTLFLHDIGFLLIAVFGLSFFKWGGTGAPEWNGINNYIKLFTTDPYFKESIKVTVYFSLLAVVGSMVYSLIVAMLLNRKIPARGFFRAVFYLPYVLPAAAVYIGWSWLYNTEWGLFNYILSKLGIERLMFVSSSSQVVPSLALIAVWLSGNLIVIFLAGLQNVPRVYHEAAEIDGANAWQRFWHVTFPSMTPIIFYNMLMALITNMQVVTPALALTKGGPGKSSYFMSYMLYNYAFKQRGKIGLACAIAFVLFLLIGAFTLLLFATSKSWIFYEGGDDK